MAIRVTVWGENVHEQTNKIVAGLYPKGMHGCIAEGLNEDAGITATTATLQEPEHGLTAARLAETEGVGEAVICELKIIEAAAQRLARARVMRRQVISSWDALVDYCHTVMAHRETEHFRVLYLDKKNALIADEEQARGTVDHVPVYPREVVKRALELNASALILVHNHPSGDPTPSDADILLTGQIGSAAEALGLVLLDHLIIGKSRELSFRASGLI
jgi:DNA repair protein RadC